jgi:23S rRNA (guanosine2251-2'-O)-methyltransferase
MHVIARSLEWGMMRGMATYVILHNIRSAHNVGSICRTADGAGVTKIYFTGYTPTPIDRFGRVNDEIRKTSLGATESVAWESWDDPETLVRKLTSDGVQVVAVEQTKYAVDYRTFRPTGDIAYVFGNEIDGVPETLCAKADAVIHIPMAGMKESLNVSVAAGIILFKSETNTQ